nr:MAG TPA: hypothetical protein [Caudoviricetes sp.]
MGLYYKCKENKGNHPETLPQTERKPQNGTHQISR